MDLLDNMAFIIDTALAPSRTILFSPVNISRADSAGFFLLKPVAWTAAATSSTTAAAAATSQIQLRPGRRWPVTATNCFLDRVNATQGSRSIGFSHQVHVRSNRRPATCPESAIDPRPPNEQENETLKKKQQTVYIRYGPQKERPLTRRRALKTEKRLFALSIVGDGDNKMISQLFSLHHTKFWPQQLMMMKALITRESVANKGESYRSVVSLSLSLTPTLQLSEDTFKGGGGGQQKYINK
jgi:hypothetical protein